MTIGRRNGASTPSIVATKPSWRANHQTHRRIPLETAIGASRTAANATMTITRKMRKIRFLNRIAVRQRGDERKAAIIGDYTCVCHSDIDRSWLATIHSSSRLWRPNAAAAPYESVVRVAPSDFSRLQRTVRYLLLSSTPSQVALTFRFQHPAPKCGLTTRFQTRAHPLVAAQRLGFARAATAP